MTHQHAAAPTQMTFNSTIAALAHQRCAGGWIFAPITGGENFWFSGLHFTPSTIMTHPLTRGKSGKIL